MKVKPRVKFTKVSRKWAKAYLRCQKAKNEDGYIFCCDCANQGRFNCCSNDPHESKEFCENFFLRSDIHV